MSETHSPLPWHLGDAGLHEATAHDIYANDGDHICTNRADAEFIIRCVNAHEALVKALNACLDTYVSLVNSGDCGFWNPETEEAVIQARAVLKLAAGEAQ